MESQVAKMYENAGIKKVRQTNIAGGDYPIAVGFEIYPLFTADKQLELIKWLAKTRPIHISFLIDKWVLEGMVRYGKRYDTFEDALSGYINNIWQDLTEEEREQIRSVLNG